RAEGVQVDAVSAGEIERALAAGYEGRADPAGLVFTADVIDETTLALVRAHGIPVNAGSVDVLHALGAGPGAPGHRVWLRINPGFGHGHSRKTNTGGEQSKHGIWWEDLASALACVRQHRFVLEGLHMHIGSGVDYAHLERVCEAMVQLAEQAAASGFDLAAVSAGGGLTVPYRGDEIPVDTAHYHASWEAARLRIAARLGHPVRLEIEPGRFLVAEAGVLLARVLAVKDMGRNHFVLGDAGFSDLVRPAMYGGFHAISVVPADGHRPPTVPATLRPTVVAGPLCESGDVFTQDAQGVVEPRELPPCAVGDLLVFHDAGAYGASMSSNYNSRPLAAEVLVDGPTERLVRRRQTMRELLALEDDPD
ncbi:MAG TPA: diaminopimelate decarboxylase, partial [Burkholderiaceae bacterium]|nr:diaminopimelate decarboxylase [Burkholderiaceae bacterium]